ncbi:MAG TPA: U32 family peptidase [Planctomycetota bacterium]|nr:U32 family peptidase [Planctomycetota bacterium]
MSSDSKSDCCSSDGLKRAPNWQGLTLASALPGVESAEAAPEPQAAQGEYNPQAPEAPLSVPLVGAQAPQHEVELLSPAGGLDAAYAAFHYGADAIYLGMKKFSARAEAENFTLDDVDEITSFAHAQEKRRRVFVTINTLVLQNELSELVESLGALSDIGVDALIIQDLGVYRIVRKHFPEIELHASTQMAVHNRAGAEALKALGFTRVVLARELTLEEVYDITATAGVETEVFIHGALCYSYSGLCLFSSQTTGRSGNRGKCAYSCRDEFQISGAPETLRDGAPTKRDPNHGFAFSMKDLALPDHLPAIRAAGVSCVKIEGRKKSPLYVATTTDYYRKLIDGAMPEDERAQHEADMKTVFSRPWTRLFTQSHKDKEVADRDTVGHRGTPVGKVEAVINAGSEMPLLRFKTERAIERHDGIQVDVPGLGKPFGFAVETLRVAEPKTPPPTPSLKGRGKNSTRAKDVFVAEAGSVVEVALPEEHPHIPEGALVYCSSSQDVKRRYRFSRAKAGQYRSRRTADIEVVLSKDGIAANGFIAPRFERDSRAEASEEIREALSPAKDAGKTETAVRTAFEKLGETRLALGKLAIRNSEKLFAPASLLNQLRRALSEKLERKLHEADEARVKAVEADVVVFPLPLREGVGGGVAPLRWSLKVDRVSYLDAFEDNDWSAVDELVIDVARDHPTLLQEKLNPIAARIGRERIRLSLPPLTRKWEEKGIQQKLKVLRAAGWNAWEAGNVSAWTYLNAPVTEKAGETPTLRLSADWSLYTVNRMAAEQLFTMGVERVTLSPEDGLENMRSLLRELGDRATVIVHQDTPMFLAESCAYANLIGGCPGKANCRFESMDMVNSYGEKVTAVDYHCRTIVLNRGAFCLAQRLEDLRKAGAVCVRAEFVYRKYEPGEVRDAWRAVRAGKNVPRGHAANFDRGML